MKNKKLTILSILVIGVWGTIGYKIYQSIGDDKELNNYRKRTIVSDSVKQESYTLVMKYDDPFLKKKIIKVSRPVVKKNIQPVQPAKVVIPPVFIDWTKVHYFGSMNNASKKINMATIKIGENEYFVKEGSSAEGFMVTEVSKDSANFTFQNQSKYIKRIKQ